jgi:hypothetical protein
VGLRFTGSIVANDAVTPARDASVVAIPLSPGVAELTIPFVAKEPRWSRGPGITKALATSAAVGQRKGIVSVDGRPRVNAATRLAEVALLDDAYGGHSGAVAG